jgi:hypothetical protein
MVLVGTVITFVPDRLVLIVETATEVVNVVVLVEFWAWTKNGNSARTAPSMCGCGTVIVENDDERREKAGRGRRAGEGSSEIDVASPGRSETVQGLNLR